MKFKFHRYLLSLIAVCGLLFFFNLDVLYVNIMEARNFGSAREMLQNDNWLLTTLNALPRYEKPPLPTWLTAISAAIFGLDKLWALRLPAALSATMLTIALYRFSLLIQVTRKQAFIAGLILCSSFYIIFSGRNGQWDIFTHAFMMVSICFLHQFFREDRKIWRDAILAGIFFGLSVLSKGPVSLYALFLPFILAYAFIYRFYNFQKKWLPLAVFIILGLAIGLWWFIYVRIADPVAFLEITKEEATNWGSYNIRPFYYYWSFFTQSGIWTIPSLVALIYPYLKDRVSNKKAYRFSILWTLLSVILLSLIPEKKSRYLLPVLIPMAVNTSFYIEYLFSNFSGTTMKEKWIVFFNFGIIALIGIAFPFVGFYFLSLQGNDYLWYGLTSCCLFGIGVMIIYYLRKKQFSRIFYLTVGFICTIIVFAFPLINSFIDNPHYKPFSNLRSFAEEQKIRVYEYNAFTPEIIWDYGRPLPLLTGNKKMNIPEQSRFGLLFPVDDSLPEKMFKGYTIKKLGQYDLNQVHPEKSGYKNRLIRNFYLLEKKTID